MLTIILLSLLIIAVSGVLIYLLEWMGFVTIVVILSLVISIVSIIFWYFVDGYQTDDILLLSRGCAVTFSIFLFVGVISTLE